MLGAFSVVSLHLICGQFSIWFGANILLLGANNLLLGAQRFGSYSIIFGAFATWYSLSQYIWSSKLLQSTCSHRICETGPQSPPFRLVTWSVSMTYNMTNMTYNIHQLQNGDHVDYVFGVEKIENGRFDRSV